MSKDKTLPDLGTIPDIVFRPTIDLPDFPTQVCIYLFSVSIHVHSIKFMVLQGMQ